MRKVVVIGGGAAGMMAAISAAEHGAQVLVLEHKDRVGKKILSTGNGRCNFTNLVQTPDCYRSENPQFPWKIIRQFDEKQTVTFFQTIGVYPKNRNGYLYPNSDQASAVLDALRMEMDRLGIEVRTETEVLEILPKKKRIMIRTGGEMVSADRVILAAGSKAAPVTGSDGSGYTLAKKLGHRIVPVLPALVQLRCRGKFFPGIAGVRIQGSVSLFVDGKNVCQDIGEIQLTQYGISGIPVFQVSRFAAEGLYQKREVKAVLNFMPQMTETEFLEFLMKRAQIRPKKTAEEFLTGLFHKKLITFWVKSSRIPKEKQIGAYSKEDMKRLARLIQKFEVDVEATNSFEQAQICCGGVATEEVREETLESCYVPGVYFAGEILDVDGICGGYNLQWAWSSGWVAGREAADVTN